MDGWRGRIIFMSLRSNLSLFVFFLFYDDEIFAVPGSTPFGTVYIAEP
jgi:hypothetical protein